MSLCISYFQHIYIFRIFYDRLGYVTTTTQNQVPNTKFPSRLQSTCM